MTENIKNNNSSTLEHLLFRLPKQPPYLEFDEFTVYFIYGYCLDPKKIKSSTQILEKSANKKLFVDQYCKIDDIETWIPPYNLTNNLSSLKRFKNRSKPIKVDLLYTRYSDQSDNNKSKQIDDKIKEILSCYQGLGEKLSIDVKSTIEGKIYFNKRIKGSFKKQKNKNNNSDKETNVFNYINRLKPIELALYKDVEINIYVSTTDFGPGTITFEVKIKSIDNLKYDVEDVLRILRLVPRVSGKTDFHAKTHILCMNLEKIPTKYREIFKILSASSSNIRVDNNQAGQEGTKDSSFSYQLKGVNSLFGRKLQEDTPTLKKESKKRKWDSDSSSLFKIDNLLRFSDLFKLHLEILNTVFEKEWTEPSSEKEVGFYGANGWLTDPQTPYIYLTTKMPVNQYMTIFKDGNLNISYKHIVKEVCGMLKKWLLYENIKYVNPKYFKNSNMIDNNEIISRHFESNIYAVFSNNLALVISPSLRRNPDPIKINTNSFLAFLEYNRLRYHHLLRINNSLDNFLNKIQQRSFCDSKGNKAYSSLEFISDLKELLPIRYRIIRILNDIHKDIWNYEIGSDLPEIIQNRLISSLEETTSSKLITIDKLLDDWNFIRKSEDLNKYYKK